MKYLCNQRIYSPRHARGEPPHEECVSRRRPLACVQYRSHDLPYDQRAFSAWLDGMKFAVRLRETLRYPLYYESDKNPGPQPPDAVEVYVFVPK